MDTNTGMKELFDALSDGEIGRVNAVLERKRDLVNELAGAGGLEWHLLSFASRRGFSGGVRVLLEHGADVNVRGRHGYTPLIHAALKNDAEIVRILVEAGADVNVRADSGETPLLLSLRRYNSVELVSLLLVHGADVNSQSERFGFTPLILATSADRYHTKIVPWLLEKGANPNARANNGETPLLAAVRRNHLEIIDVLLNYGADVNSHAAQSLVEDRLALLQASCSDSLFSRRFDTEDERGETPLMLAINLSRVDILRKLLLAHADVNLCRRRGDTALILAIRTTSSSCEEITRMLVEYGADVNAPNSRDDTPLTVAISHNRVELARLLLGKGADANRLNQDGDTPLLLAIHKHCEDRNKARSLLDREGDAMSAPDMILDSTQNCVEIMQLLLEYGADLDARNHLGNTALIKTCEMGFLDGAYILIRASPHIWPLLSERLNGA
jgi:ankyrin repeat protein